MTDTLKPATSPGRPALTVQAHTYREAWLGAATEVLRLYFEGHGHPLPERINFAVAFPSTGSKGNRIGEHWAASATADGTHTIIIRADLSDPVQVLGVLVHELCHAAAPAGAKHGPQFKAVATAVGLEGKMIHAAPGAVCKAYLSTIVTRLGPLPHSRLNFNSAGRKKKQGSKTQKCVCEDCGYNARVPLQCIAEAGPPLCPIDNVTLTPGGKYEGE